MTPARPLRFRDRDYAAFLFDMDGTVLDSSAVVDRVWRDWAIRHEVDADALMATVHGVRAEDTIRRFAPDGLDVAAEAKAMHDAEVADVEGVVPIKGVGAFVAGLPRGRWAIVTSAPRTLAEVRLRAAGLPIPDTLIAAEDVARGKPDPEGFVTAAERLGVPIADCLAFEDSPAGVEAARAAGASVVIVGRRTPPDDGGVAIDDFEDRSSPTH